MPDYHQTSFSWISECITTLMLRAVAGHYMKALHHISHIRTQTHCLLMFSICIMNLDIFGSVLHFNTLIPHYGS